MRYAPKVVLVLPIRDPAALGEFVVTCLRDRVELIAVVGDGCVQVEDLIDDIVVADGSKDDRFVVTTSHPGESLADVMEFADLWTANAGEGVQEVRL